MKAILTFGTLTVISLSLFSPIIHAEYAKTICTNSELYDCYKVKKGETWESMFPDPENRSFVKKINRMNIQVRPGLIIAVPKDKSIDSVEFLKYSPFPQNTATNGEELIKVDLSDLAWAAYDSDGTLVKWGPISGGKSSSTITGTFTFYRKQGNGCVSSKYPIPRGGAPMPYCMHFKGPYAMHGSPTVPGFHASHGCVRLFTDDAKWLNENFVDTGSTKVRVQK
ncbi:L,D-transpeptidase family protein [Candidatus Berkiella aquae]|uniref:L,D-transpeptidase n=1 Tax=Candidatus Berkiella aquae TaxID=295108 RepID=A0A0Q9YEI3_9GAMM|nr:L,D-transpeptidase [Candidatus Berkiella aquae]MCS5711641.1 L,D-transpeptidase [Candidatus Berkiella aquae]